MVIDIRKHCLYTGCFCMQYEDNQPVTELAAHKSAGKPQVGDMDSLFVLDMGDILTQGLTKYPNDPDGMPNWYKGGSYRSFCASILRHALKLASGEDIDSCPKIDPEGDCAGALADTCPLHSRLPHAAHIAIDAMFVRSWQRRKVGQDDRLW